MTNFTDQVFLRLNGSLPIIQLPTDAVKKMWWFEDGKWAPMGFTDHGDSYLTFTNDNANPPDISLNLFLYSMADTGGEPLLAIDRGLNIQKDISAGGYIASNQGALWLGSGLNNQLDIPKIILMNSGASLLNGGGYADLPSIPTGHSGSGSFPSGQPAGTFYLRTDANEPYHNRLYKFDGTNWNDTTPNNEKSRQLFRSTDAIFGQPADTIFNSYCSTHIWNWSPVGPASDYADKYFDTLYLTKLDNTPGHMDLGNLTSHGNMSLDGELTILGNGVKVPNYKWIQWGSNTRLYEDGDGILKVQHYTDAGHPYEFTWQLGVMKMSTIFADHINSASGEGIYCFDHLKIFNGTSNSIKLYDSTNQPGSDGQVLKNVGGYPQWATLPTIASIQKGTVNTDASGSASVTFPQSFGSTPSITCTPVDPSGRHISVVITAQSNEQFSIKATVTGDHKHKVGDIFGTDTFGLSVDSTEDHTHSFSAGAHTHMIGTASATVGWTMGIDSQGSHSHTVVGTSGVGGAHNHTVVGTTGTGSAHSHNVNNHTHAMTGASGNGTTGSTSGHTHSYTYYYVSGWVTGGSSPSTTSESSHTHYYSGYSSDVGNHSHTYSGYSGNSGSHSHNLTNKPPYVRSLMLRDSGGVQQDLGGLLNSSSGSQFDLYTLSSGGGGGTTGSAGGHTHNLSNKPAYTRGVSLRTLGGSSFTIGGVLANDSVVGTTEAHTETTNPVSNIAITVNWTAVG